MKTMRQTIEGMALVFDPIEAGDELLFVASSAAEEALQEMLSPHHGVSTD